MCGAEEGFGHGWPAQPRPGPAPTCSAIQSRAAATLDRGLKPTPGLHRSPSKGRAAGLSGRGTWGVRRGGACAPPDPSTARQPLSLQINYGK